MPGCTEEYTYTVCVNVTSSEAPSTMGRDSFICDHWRQLNVLLTQLLIALPVNAVTNLRSNCVYTIV